MSEIALIFPHQLFNTHPALKSGRRVVLVEDSLFFGDRFAPARFHKQKLLLHRASMAAYARELVRRGHEVECLSYDPSRTARDTMALLAKRGVREVHLADPVDYLLAKRLRESAQRNGVALHIHPTPMFLTDVGWAAEVMARKRRYLMADFYVAQRLRLGLLVEDGRPVGGRWSFDAENRKPLPATLALPPDPPPRANSAILAVAAGIEREFPGNPGSTEGFWFPVTRRDALAGLEAFLESRLAHFGDYEDAISSRRSVLFHSVLTPALNIGLLTPREVIDRTLEFAAGRAIPLNSLEGFIRQIVGWREFIRVLYEMEGTRIRTSNFWNHTRPLSRAWYEGSTGLAPVDAVIRRVLNRAWCHHIERLMILSNAMLLCRIRPDDVYRWFMEMFIDAYDWVMVPNVYGMGLFADGGLFATKPYISGSAYIRRMSDFRPGPWCEIWDSLFWAFIGDHRDFFAGHPRLAMMARTWDRLGVEKQREHRDRASRFLEKLV
ncbi:MAG: cryptochrome/photolyase family protein [Kiritimatiellae bacterium]|nr:cryptochrome/photolyase family protein [Kiritimatiellia bacterium]MDW8457939.1 cryptochrome/photolyase family protein [Verrucomicrobiota bacterium]